MRRLFACAQLGNTTGWLGNRVPKAPRQATCPPAIKVRLPASPHAPSGQTVDVPKPQRAASSPQPTFALGPPRAQPNASGYPHAKQPPNIGLDDPSPDGAPAPKYEEQEPRIEPPQPHVRDPPHPFLPSSGDAKSLRQGPPPPPVRVRRSGPTRTAPQHQPLQYTTESLREAPSASVYP